MYFFDKVQKRLFFKHAIIAPQFYFFICSVNFTHYIPNFSGFFGIVGMQVVFVVKFFVFRQFQPIYQVLIFVF